MRLYCKLLQVLLHSIDLIRVIQEVQSDRKLKKVLAGSVKEGLPNAGVQVIMIMTDGDSLCMY